MKNLYVLDIFVGERLLAPCVTLAIVDEEGDAHEQVLEHLLPMAAKITNEHIENDFSYVCRLSIVGEQYVLGNFGKWSFSEIFETSYKKEESDDV